MNAPDPPEIQKSAGDVDATGGGGNARAQMQQQATFEGGGRVSDRGDLARLIGRVAASSDRDAFRQLFLGFGPAVKGMLIRQGAEAHTAEEIVQDTFLTVWRKAAMFSSERGSAATWIFTIARNLRIDRIRREVPWQDLGEDHLEQASEDPLPDESLASRQIQDRMRDVLSKLPADQVEVVRLAYMEGLSHGEIADRLGLALGTVKSRMRLAYKKIKESFEDAA